MSKRKRIGLYEEGQCQSYVRNKEGNYVVKNGDLVKCLNMGTRRGDNGLDSGIHCNDCWERLIYEARSRSW